MSPALSKGESRSKDTVRVCHLVSGDLWAGAEVQVATILPYLGRRADFDVSAILLNEGRLAEELRRHGIGVTVIDESRLTSAGIFRKLLGHLERAPVDILHTHRYKENILGGLAAKAKSVPHLVRTIHGLREIFAGIRDLKMRMYSCLDDLAGRYLTDRVVAVSEDIRRSLGARYRSEQLVCIHNAIDAASIRVEVDRHTKRRELRVPDGSRIIGTIGRLAPIKGVADFLRATHHVVKKRANVTGLVIGDGPLRRDLERLAHELGLGDVVSFTGHCDDIYDLINVMDVVVLPSLHEGLPTVLLEALAMGKPVVATRVGGIPEVVRQPELGLLVEPRNPWEMADRCLTVLDGLEADGELAAARRRYIAEHHSVEVIGPKVADLYWQVIRGSKR